MIDRRNIIAALASAPALVCVPALAASASENPVDRFQRFEREYNARLHSQEQYIAALDAFDAWAPTTHREFVQKFHAMFLDGGAPAEYRVELMLDQAKRLLAMGGEK